MTEVKKISGDGFDGGDVKVVSIASEMRKSYLDYAMSVIVSRALPDVRDGLKPVQRRILYTMDENGLDHNKPHRKSAITVGAVIGHYHPHGDTAAYDAMVRMAQSFTMSVPLIDGHGNFGSMDGDKAAAYRYTEARLSKASFYLLKDIEKATVDFQPNFDNSCQEPTVLPAGFPNILVNGASGIAVGMATQIPPHNLGEVLDACCAYINDPTITSTSLLNYVKGPDFPTGALIIGSKGLQDIYEKGRGGVMMRSRSHIEDIGKDKQAIIITQVPYQVNKARMIERIAECIKEKIIEGISDLRDESDRKGVRVVIEVKRGFDPNVILNQLYRHTPAQTSFNANMLALDHGRPRTFSLREFIVAFVEFRAEVVTKRTQYNLDKATAQAHLLLGLAIAVANIDEIIAIIKAAPNPGVAKQQLVERAWNYGDIAPLIKLVDHSSSEDDSNNYILTLTQATAILELKLHRLTGLEREKIDKDLREISEKIREYTNILNSRTELFKLINEEFLVIRESFAIPRRTEIIEDDLAANIEDLIQKEDMVVTISHQGYIKRVPLVTYRAQKRGGKGRSGMSTKENDFVSTLIVASTHTNLLFFSSHGMAYHLKVYQLPFGSPTAKGRPVINILPLKPGEKISTVLALPEDEEEWAGMDIMFATSRGNVRRNCLTDFLNIKSNGKIAMKLDVGESLIGVQICNMEDNLFLSTKYGRSIRFNIDDVRRFAGRASNGVRGIKLIGSDEVISMAIFKKVKFSVEERNSYLSISGKTRRGEMIFDEAWQSLSKERYDDMNQKEEFILTVTDKGFGKRTSAYEYRIYGRGGQGLTNIDLNDKNGKVVAAFPVQSSDQIMLVTNSGKLIRCAVNDIRMTARKAIGVTLFRIDKGEKVVSVERIDEGDKSVDEEAEAISDESNNDQE